MSVTTKYDEMRAELKNNLNECLKQAKELVVSDDVWGYDEMREGYSIDVYNVVKKARDTV